MLKSFRNQQITKELNYVSILKMKKFGLITNISKQKEIASLKVSFLTRLKFYIL